MRQVDPNPPAIVKTAVSLEEELAQKIKEREEKIVKTTLEHARLQGADLLRAKQHLGPRKFAPWFKANFGFSRQTAYTYMKVASEWSAICQGALQMGTLQEVVQKLFGEGKVKKKSKHGSAQETDPTNSRQVEDPKTESEPGEKSETPSESERAENHESQQDHATPEREQQETPDEQSRERDADGNENKPGKETRSKSRRNKTQANNDDPVSAPRKLVIPIKDARVQDYLEYMMNDLLEGYRERGFLERIFPEDLQDDVKKEDTPARIILELMQFAFNSQKMRKNMHKQGGQQAN